MKEGQLEKATCMHCDEILNDDTARLQNLLLLMLLFACPKVISYWLDREIRDENSASKACSRNEFRAFKQQTAEGFGIGDAVLEEMLLSKLDEGALLDMKSISLAIPQMQLIDDGDWKERILRRRVVSERVVRHSDSICSRFYASEDVRAS